MGCAVRVGEASNPGLARTWARVRLDEEDEAVLTGLGAAVTRIDDSSDDEPLMPTWRDEVSQREEMGRGSDVRNVRVVTWRTKEPSLQHSWI